jgi:hypothetical protein
MSETWFEEVLLPAEDQVKAIIKGTPGEEPLPESVAQRIRQTARGIVRVQHPRWRALTAEESAHFMPQKGSRFILVRLGYEFDLPADAKANKVRFTAATCKAYIWSVDTNQAHPVQPKVVDVVPRDLRTGKPQTVQLELAPQVKLDGIGEASLGKLSTEFTIGLVEPVCLGFTGEKSQEPYWTLQPQTETLMGIRHFWLVVDVPQNCHEITLATRAEGTLQTSWRPFTVRSKNMERASLPSVTITVA